MLTATMRNPGLIGDVRGVVESRRVTVSSNAPAGPVIATSAWRAPDSQIAPSARRSTNHASATSLACHCKVWSVPRVAWADAGRCNAQVGEVSAPVRSSPAALNTAASSAASEQATHSPLRRSRHIDLGPSRHSRLRQPPRVLDDPHRARSAANFMVFPLSPVFLLPQTLPEHVYGFFPVPHQPPEYAQSAPATEALREGRQRPVGR